MVRVLDFLTLLRLAMGLDECTGFALCTPYLLRVENRCGIHCSSYSQSTFLTTLALVCIDRRNSTLRFCHFQRRVSTCYECLVQSHSRTQFLTTFVHRITQRRQRAYGQ